MGSYESAKDALESSLAAAKFDYIDLCVLFSNLRINKGGW